MKLKASNPRSVPDWSQGDQTAVKAGWLQGSAGPLISPESSWLSSGKTCDQKPSDKCEACYCCWVGVGFFPIFCLSWLNAALVPGRERRKPVSHALCLIPPTAPSLPYLPSNLPFWRHNRGRTRPCGLTGRSGVRKEGFAVSRSSSALYSDSNPENRSYPAHGWADG